MNTYYHAFTPEPWQHLYFYIGFAMLVLMALASSKQWRMIRRVIVRQFDDKVLLIMSGALGFIFACIFTTESYDGIVQWFVNRITSTENPALVTGFGLMTCWVISLALAAVVFYLVARLFSNAKNGKLNIQLDEYSQEQEIKEIRRKQARQIRQTRHDVRAYRQNRMRINTRRGK